MSTLIVGDRITIRYSKLLDSRGLGTLANKTGVVTKVVNMGKNVVGAYVDVKVLRHIRNHYIPASSIEMPDKINKTRTLSILKSTIL